MSKAEFSNRKVAGKMEVHHSAIDRLMQRLQSTEMLMTVRDLASPAKVNTESIE
jgi:IS30 family transposase